MAEGESRKQALDKLASMDDPLRIELFSALIRKPTSAAELAEELGAPIGRVRYQLGRMREAGLVEVLEERPRRGVVEQVYTSEPMVVSAEDVAELTREEMERGHAMIVKMVIRDFLAVVRRGTFASREDFMAVRLPLRLDEEGWRLASDLQHETLDRFLTIHADAQARISSTENDAVDVLAYLFLFEAATGDN